MSISLSSLSSSSSAVTGGRAAPIALALDTVVSTFPPNVACRVRFLGFAHKNDLFQDKNLQSRGGGAGGARGGKTSSSSFYAMSVRALDTLDEMLIKHGSDGAKKDDEADQKGKDVEQGQRDQVCVPDSRDCFSCISSSSGS